jgi:hypothetical protein
MLCRYTFCVHELRSEWCSSKRERSTITRRFEKIKNKTPITMFESKNYQSILLIHVLRRRLLQTNNKSGKWFVHLIRLDSVPRWIYSLYIYIYIFTIYLFTRPITFEQYSISFHPFYLIIWTTFFWPAPHFLNISLLIVDHWIIRFE